MRNEVTTVACAVQSSLDPTSVAPKSLSAMRAADRDLSAIDWRNAHDSHAPKMWARWDVEARNRFDRETRHWRDGTRAHYPRHIAQLLENGTWSEYDRVKEQERTTGRTQRPTAAMSASSWLTSTHNAILAAKPQLAFDELELKWRARRYASQCSRLSKAQAIDFARSEGVNPVPPNGRTQGLRSLMSSARWWTRRLRQLYAENCENAFRRAGWIHRHADAYVSQDALERHRAQRTNNARFLKACDVIDIGTGEVFPLDQFAAASVSNPKNRRAELMVRIKGFEQIAMREGHTALFFTLTAPSAFHRMLVSGDKNPRFADQAANVRDAQSWLRKVWARVRAKLARLEILVYGFRISEPHHDATPHWHLLVFTPRDQAESVTRTLTHAWLQEYADEVGAYERRCTVKTIDLHATGKDGRRCGAVGYIAKYIAKNVDGYRLDSDDPGETSLSGDAAAERVEAWARTHGIRQFQQIGGPSISVWRELRRLRDKLLDADVERIRAAADAGDFAAYIDASGGIASGRSRFFRVATFRDEVPGMWELIEVTRSDADLPPKLPPTVGVLAIVKDGAKLIKTRFTEWVRVFSRPLSLLTLDPWQ
jgi:hypothetical protein